MQATSARLQRISIRTCRHTRHPDRGLSRLPLLCSPSSPRSQASRRHFPQFPPRRPDVWFIGQHHNMTSRIVRTDVQPLAIWRYATRTSEYGRSLEREREMCWRAHRTEWTAPECSNGASEWTGLPFQANARSDWPEEFRDDTRADHGGAALSEFQASCPRSTRSHVWRGLRAFRDR